MSSIWEMRRSADDARIAGVCGGLARHWHVDPVLVRVGCALLALSGGIGLVLYVAGWLLIPQDGRSSSILHDSWGDQIRTWPRELWVAMVVLACLLAFGALGSISPFGFGPAVVLALIWYFGFYKRRSVSGPPPAPGQAPRPLQAPPVGVRPPAPPPRPEAPPAPAPPGAGWSHPGPAAPVPQPSPFTEAAVAWQHRVAEANYFAHPDPVGLYQPANPDQSVATAPTVTVPRSRSASARRLRWVTFSALAVVLGGLGVAENVGGVPIPVSAYFAAALAVIGLALIAATRFGRARGLLPVGLLLLIAVVGSTAMTQIELPEMATQNIRYGAVAALPDTPDTLASGTLAVDLSDLDLDGDAAYQAEVGVGALQVTVPPDTNVIINYRIDKGVFSAYGDHVVGGTDLDSSLVPDPVLPERPTLTLDVQVDVGHVEIRR